MCRIVATVLVCGSLLPAAAFAADTSKMVHAAGEIARHFAPQGVLSAAVSREASRLAASFKASAEREREEPAKQPGWISRHPVLFATLVGAGAGAGLSMTMENEWFCSGGDEDCIFHGGGRVFLGAGIGAGVGALAGTLATIGRK